MKLQITFEITSEVLKKNPQFIDELEKMFNEMIRRAAGDEPTEPNNGNDVQQPEKRIPAPPPFPLSERSVRINGIPVGEEPLANVKEIADYIGASVKYIRFLVMKKRIPFFKIGRFVRFRMSEIDAWIIDRGKGQRKKPGRKPASGSSTQNSRTKPGPEEIE